MYPVLQQTITSLLYQTTLSEERKEVLIPLVDSLIDQLNTKGSANIVFICTHNSRRSHLAQVWAQVAAHYYGCVTVDCYSGGTEETALAPQVALILQKQGMDVSLLAVNDNPIYSLKYDSRSAPLIGFSKKYNHVFNPASEFIAVMTCSQADGDCPFISGASHRVAIAYTDPKIFDGQPEEERAYREASLSIAQEMFYVFSQVKNKR
ncbi:protein-tyrosine-phosphatase [Myroides sp. 1354]|uniref:protein-tyrosine-phosphatase n=1 Tax=unclassified Myroides TaxID=2642485 RepID=UPI0025771FCC|nr:MULTISPECIES: protein-tyrosine-phosphatase [unclassified Myroides]MDM1045440.1 protein-tyrosine-phosphatase [Myroides sp. R163-1]MDM1056323.1 protein-tyrosine-phosphatase [Myroides sp. 1354]MDM1069570.1 protein-tyrosine-phosphatase [Myroides sp. 1372]